MKLEEYNQAIERYELIKGVKTEAELKEKLMLVHRIENHENSLWDLPDVDPVEMMKIRTDDFTSKINY